MYVLNGWALILSRYFFEETSWFFVLISHGNSQLWLLISWRECLTQFAQMSSFWDALVMFYHVYKISIFLLLQPFQNGSYTFSVLSSHKVYIYMVIQYLLPASMFLLAQAFRLLYESEDEDIPQNDNVIIRYFLYCYNHISLKKNFKCYASVSNCFCNFFGVNCDCQQRNLHPAKFKNVPKLGNNLHQNKEKCTKIKVVGI